MKKLLFAALLLVILPVSVVNAERDLLELRTLGSRVSPGGGFIIVEGTVRNIYDKPLKDIQVVAMGYGGPWAKEFVSSSTALIEYNPILPDQISPFTVYLDYNPAIKEVKVEFKEFFGGTIPWRTR
jgi:hypothetical protein